MKKTFLSILLFLFLVPVCFGYSKEVIVGGENIGIELKSKGVIVVGFYKVDNKYIASEAGLKVGDKIISINDALVDDASSIQKVLENSNGNIKITYERDSVRNDLSLSLNKDSNGMYKTGIYIKDTITGIGTITYIDPNTKLFGALGHEIIESTTRDIFDIKSGNIYSSSVTDIEPSYNGTPGEKNAIVNHDNVKGSIFENTIKGIFGNYTGNFDNTKLYKVASINDIKKGEAKILTVLSGESVMEYTINITKINKNSETKNISFEITDKELLEKTNGIVQGMSGSPIIQGEYIVGAVTHVVVDNPHKGYGIFITKMLEEAEN